jgi:hypothetical protein
MSYPQRRSGEAQGLFNDSSAGSASLEENRLNGSPGLGRAFDLGFGILNSYSFDQQNQNIDVALHAIENFGQIAAAFPSSQDHLGISASVTSLQQVPNYYTGNPQVIENQIYHPNNYLQTGHIFGPGETPILPELLDRFRDVQNLQVKMCQTMMESKLTRCVGRCSLESRR